MFDIGASELLLTVIVAIVVIGPKDLPRALRLAGGWIGKIRRLSGHFRSGIEEMIRQAELEEMEKKWKEQNEAIMRQESAAAAAPEAGAAAFDPALPPPYSAELPGGIPAAAEPTLPTEAAPAPVVDTASPELPLGPRKARP